MKNAASVANEPSIVNSMNVGVENHAKGGYHAPLSNATGKHFHFFGACISVFPEDTNWRSAVLSRGSRRDQKRFHQAGVGKTANSLLKDGAKIHLKNRRLHKSTQTRAPTIEILPVLSPNKVMGVT